MAKRPGDASHQQRGSISRSAKLHHREWGSRHVRCSTQAYAARAVTVVIETPPESPMRPTQQEFASPREWLTRLAEESDGYRRLVRESGGTGRAAYRLARARCTATLGREPDLEDLQAAAELLAARLGSGGALPIKSLLPSAKSSPPPTPSPDRRAAEKSRARPARVSA